ncbi:MAG: amidophosphoribosyltransferase, partial [Elstera sp.]
VEAMTKFIGADSLAFVSIDGLYRAMGHDEGRVASNPGFCDACFTGDYPIPLTDFTDGTSDDRVSVLAE